MVEKYTQTEEDCGGLIRLSQIKTAPTDTDERAQIHADCSIMKQAGRPDAPNQMHTETP